MDDSRRAFLRRSAAAAASLALWPVARPARRRVSAADQITFGVIGCNGMGFSNARSLLNLPETRCLALCDVDAGVLARRAADLEEMGQVKPRLYSDYRALLDNDDLDVVVIGTPDHWHCLMTVDALEAGKHVYVEKPLANSIQECDVMRAAAAAHDRVVQVGQWQRSGPHWQQAVRFVHSGRLGNIRTVKTWAYQGWMKPVPVRPNQSAPDGVDYAMWLGPAPQRPFNPNRFHFNFRWFWDYAGGLMTDWGVHIIDFALYGMDAGYPRSVMASGGKFAYPDDASETPDTLQTVYEFDGFTMLWEHATGIDLGPYGRNHGVAFIGNNGTLVVDRNGWEVIPEVEDDAPKMDLTPSVQRDGNDLDRHTANFIAAVKGEARPNAGIDVGHHTAVVAHMGNIAYRTGRKLYWNQDEHRFTDDDANELARADYHQDWTLPKY